MIIQLYRKGISTREIADIIEKMYGSVNNTPKKTYIRLYQLRLSLVEKITMIDSMCKNITKSIK